MKINRMYMHKSSKDTAFIIKGFQNNRKALVTFYNINFSEISGQSYFACQCGDGAIRLQDESEYIELED